MLVKDLNQTQPQCGKQNNSLHHTFEIKSITQQTRQVPDVVVNLSPNIAETTPKGNIYPQWNTDGMYYTECFVRGIDKHFNEQNRSFEFEAFKKRVNRACNPSSELHFPEPAKYSSYCNVCKINYENYMNHINSPKHQQLFQNSWVNQYIHDLCSDYPQKTVKKIRFQNKTTNKKTTRSYKNKQKVIYEGSTVDTKKQNQKQIQIQFQPKTGRHKGIIKITPRKMSLRNYKPN